ncbi:MAG TPA: XylR family transcriptional regulator [Planctomycetes bacterium]|nr:XylR family transcriptional regulator [Planctomycetota bacterium]
MATLRKIALLVETSRGYGRGLLRGIVRYASVHGPWSFYITPGDFKQMLPTMRAWGGTGIIARIETAAVARRILAAGLPVVALDLSEEQLAPGSPLSRFCEIHPDPAAAVDLAIEHLRGCGFTRFAFVGVPGRVWSRNRERAFAARLKRERIAVHIYESPRSARGREWAQEQETLAAWLKTLPRPIGLMACNDDRGRQVLEACLSAGLQVPEEIGVVGMDNDELLCEMCTPPLSSVALNTERGGYAAAALLDRLMAGTATGPTEIAVEPLWVVARASTDVLAIEDRRVAAALRFIRDHGTEPIRVRDILAEVPVSRRALELRFRAVAGCSINTAIQQAHFQRARQLLVQTDYSLKRVAEMSGFGSQSYMAQMFRRKAGMTPLKYRREHRTR